MYCKDADRKEDYAFLCSNYVKGRDWYDFLWYVAKEISPNFTFLKNAIDQQGPWAKQGIEVTSSWYLKMLEEKIRKIDWQQAASDVAPFLNERDRQTLIHWRVPLFLDRVEKLSRTIKKD